MMKIEILPLSALISFMVLITVKSILLKTNGIQLSRGKKRITAKKTFVIFLFLAVFMIWFIGLLNLLLDQSNRFLPDSVSLPMFEIPVLKITGSVLIIASVILFFITLIHFKNSLRFGLDSKNLGALITSGIFSVSRNPFFLSLDIYFTGNALSNPSVINIAFGILAVLVIHLFILKEEKFLMQFYKDKYTEYVRKVRRYF